VIGTSSRVSVVASTGRAFRAQVVARDPELDLAAVHAELEVPAVLPVAETDAGLGDHVFAIRAQLTGPRAAEGLVVEQRALGADFLLATSVQVERGNSGGPLVNDRGEVVGIMIRSSSERPGTAATLSFAVKSSSARKALAMLPEARAPGPRDRAGAIERARRASCMVLAR
jgi:serine protease Do